MSSVTHGLTYDEIARRLYIPRCRGIRSNGQRCYLDHETGLVVDGLVHWGDRRTTRAGIRRFLTAASKLRVTDAEVPVANAPAWALRYMRLRWVVEMVRNLGFVFPASTWADDKAKLRAMISRVKPTEATTDLRTEALRWAR